MLSSQGKKLDFLWKQNELCYSRKRNSRSAPCEAGSGNMLVLILQGLFHFVNIFSILRSMLTFKKIVSRPVVVKLNRPIKTKISTIVGQINRDIMSHTFTLRPIWKIFFFVFCYTLQTSKARKAKWRKYL